jgi:tetratricopeptide (TPR) repeat protein
MRPATLILLSALSVSGTASSFQERAAPSLLDRIEAVSLFGKPLLPVSIDASIRARLDSNLAAARSQYENDPTNAENIIWLGRRLAYLWRYREAIAVFSEGIAKHPDDPRMYRHRGHRSITVREFDNAIADLEHAATLIAGKADEVEPDGAPNPFNIPTSTLNSNIWYHLGLAYYLKGDFHNALRAYRACMTFSTNDDMLCATSDWLYMTYRRLGDMSSAASVLAPIKKEMTILENHAYHRRLLMYKGEIAPDSLLNLNDANDLDLATQGYGVGNWLLYQGEIEKAKAVFKKVLEGTYWAAFGYIAAEADLKRMEEGQ